jgi:hypothetical protein
MKAKVIVPECIVDPLHLGFEPSMKAMAERIIEVEKNDRGYYEGGGWDWDPTWLELVPEKKEEPKSEPKIMKARVKSLTCVHDKYNLGVTGEMKKLVGKVIEVKQDPNRGEVVFGIGIGGWSWDKEWLEFLPEEKPTPKKEQFYKICDIGYGDDFYETRAKYIGAVGTFERVNDNGGGFFSGCFYGDFGSRYFYKVKVEKYEKKDGLRVVIDSCLGIVSFMEHGNVVVSAIAQDTDNFDPRTGVAWCLAKLTYGNDFIDELIKYAEHK